MLNTIYMTQMFKRLGKKGNLGVGGIGSLVNKTIIGLVGLIILFAVLGSGLILTTFNNLTNFTSTMSQVDSTGVSTALAVILPIILVLALFSLALIHMQKIGGR